MNNPKVSSKQCVLLSELMKKIEAERYTRELVEELPSTIIQAYNEYRGSEDNA